MEIEIKSTEQLADAARTFISNIGERRIFAFYGKMGAGKTTFIKAICTELGVEDVITSPTFAIVNEYEIAPKASSSLSNNLPAVPTQSVYHFDFYRIKRLEEVYDMGYEEYFYSGALCFIEWPELIEQLLPEDTVRVRIEQLPDDSRKVSF
ncbi:MAG: tRNA (adenosine(37)-N6)-threonylcarbamoyltransferase complex ATPase subunit type 1 TsaE [Prevotella sp.]|nr:tRNA (adenosine(37)-N6)-threonylcarbamoyltransferase complex ATPase subunit type 1 TsaE [Prevotella sp.]MBQ2337542.1 tRNA (adenosine(37)-N6)-threonylcarbamoyltransferase complex ATPase subunit type 1 TsaE [Prevotella sp.]MBR2250775.1 tRNA (adenosine(37)-N6)-threonylcarbamoyltransferase complex ATPase subunit type 1 TsaE [Prevotella sp.]